MKRTFTTSSMDYQVHLKLDKTSLEKDPGFPLENNVLSLSDLLRLLTSSLVRDELIFIRNLCNKEIEERTAILRELIPDDVWMCVFRILAKKKDISKVFPLRQVCKRWYNSFCESLHEATILRARSIEGVINLTQLRILTIKSKCNITLPLFNKVFSKLQKLSLKCEDLITSSPSLEVLPEMWSHMISLTSLTLSDTKEPSSLINEHNFTLLTNLRKLKVRNDYFDRSATIVNVNNLRHLIHLTHLNSNAFCSSKEEFENRYGVNFQVFDNFKELKEVKFTFERAHVDCTLVQETYPSVRFLWLDTEYLPVKNYYEGELDEENYFSGKGFMYYSNGDIYEGEWKRRQREGRGIMKYYNGSVYEGEWKSNQREGKGIIKFTHGGIFEGPWSNDSIVPSGTAIWIFLDGDRYEGGYKLAGSKLIREGKGVTTCPNGYRIEGQWQDGKLNGFGSQFYVNENRYQGEWKNGKKEGEGIFLYSNGGHYQGSFQDNRIEGIGTIVYANGDRYKGEWKNNKKEGKGVYVYANYLVSF